MAFKLFATFFLGIALLAEEPFGIDADLIHSSNEPNSTCEGPRLAVAMIRFHQEVISPADGPRSHYIPSSSQYTINAMRKYGFMKGFHFGCDRLMRENNDPWIYETVPDGQGGTLKFNPVK